MPCSAAETHSKQLTLRYTNGDDGTRSLAAGSAYWLSPDLTIAGGLDAATANVGADNHIRANVHNEGDAPVSNINLEVWVCNFTMGINPSSALTSSNPGGGPMTGFAPGPIPSGGNLTVDCGIWHPTDADVALNGGHVCIAGNCYGDGDGAPFSGSDFKFLCDCHHGQHNIAVVHVAMRHMDNFMFQMMIGNPLLRQPGSETFVTIHQGRKFVRPQQDLGGSEVFIPDNPFSKQGVHIGDAHQETHITDTGQFSVAERSALLTSRHTLLAADQQQFKLASHFGDFTVQPSLLNPRSVGLTFAGDVQAVDANNFAKMALRKDQQVPMTVNLAFDPADRPGSTHLFDLTQATADGEVVGGARIITVLTP